MTDAARARLTILLSLAALMTIDQITKIVAIETLRGVAVQRFFGDTFRLVYAENTGVFLGMGRNLPEGVRFWLFTLAVGLVLAFILYETMRRPSAERWKRVAITLILAGGLGNLVDRIIRDGVVIDFMNMGIGSLRTGIFNVADVLITTGALMFLILEFVLHPPAPVKSPTAAPATDEGTPS